MSKINKAVLNITNLTSTEAARIYFTKRSRAYKITKHDSARISLLFFLNAYMSNLKIYFNSEYFR